MLACRGCLPTALCCSSSEVLCTNRACRPEELALEPSIRRLVTDFADSTGLRVPLEIRLANNASLPPDIAQAVYRAVQEGLTNVQRHAHATQVSVGLNSSLDSVTPEIQDDGVGTVVGASGQHPSLSGYGLIGLRERVALLDGRLAFGPSPGGGSCLRISIPIRDGRSMNRNGLASA